MHLLQVLACGIPAASNGRALLYKRGTSTEATWYADYDGTQPNGSGYVTLDSIGGATAYVNEHVDVVVQDESGVTLREFTDMVADSAIEVISKSFTGADYTGGASGASKPAVLQAIMDLWKDTNGAVDWLVKVGSTTDDIPTFLSQVCGVVYNVKDPTYGAVGDSTTDDTTAIQAAITAAHNAGGGVVVVPAGTYKTTDTLNCYSDVSLIGSGSASTLIRIAAAATAAITFGAASSDDSCVVSGLSVSSSEANSASAVSVTAAANATFRNCEFGDGTYMTTGVSVAAAAARLLFERCTFRYLSAGDGFSGAAQACNVTFVECAFYAPAGTCAGSAIDSWTAYCYRCIFDGSAASTGTFAYISVKQALTKPVLVSGCYFTATDGATATAISNATTGNLLLSESGSRFLCDVAFSTLPDNGHVIDFGTREASQLQTNHSGSDTLTPDMLTYSVHYVRKIDSTGHTLALGAPDYSNQRVTIYYCNTSGSPAAVTVTGTKLAAVASFTPGGGEQWCMELVGVDENGTLKWYPLVNAKIV